MFGHNVFSHFYAEGDSLSTLRNARWFDGNVADGRYDYAKSDDDGIYQTRSWSWNVCGGIQYVIYQGVHQINKHYADDRNGKKEKIHTWIIDSANENKSIYNETFTQNYFLEEEGCRDNLDSVTGATPCFSMANRESAANDQAQKAIKWLENKYPDKLCTGEENIVTVQEWNEMAEKDQEDEDETITEEPTNNTGLYLLIGGVVVIGGIITYQMS